MRTTRRQFIKSSAVGMACMSLGRAMGSTEELGTRIPIGFQLFTVRGEMSRDVSGTLKSLGQIGYKGVEFWDYAGTQAVYQKYTAADLRRMLDDQALKCCGMHVRKEALVADALKRTVETNQVLGSRYINLVMARDDMKSESGIAGLAALLNRTSEQCRAQKMVLGYHCHGFDFARIGGRFAWNILFSQLNPQINMQLDVGNCLDGGGDPIATLKEFPGRSWTVHIKEHQDRTFESEFYSQVFRLCETVAGTKWYIVEMGGQDGNGFDVPREVLAKLHHLGK